MVLGDLTGCLQQAGGGPLATQEQGPLSLPSPPSDHFGLLGSHACVSPPSTPAPGKDPAPVPSRGPPSVARTSVRPSSPPYHAWKREKTPTPQTRDQQKRTQVQPPSPAPGNPADTARAGGVAQPCATWAPTSPRSAGLALLQGCPLRLRRGNGAQAQGVPSGRKGRLVAWSFLREQEPSLAVALSYSPANCTPSTPPGFPSSPVASRSGCQGLEFP